MQADVFGIAPITYAEANFPELVPAMKKYIQPKAQAEYAQQKDSLVQYQRLQHATQMLEQLQIANQSVVQTPRSALTPNM